MKVIKLTSDHIKNVRPLFEKKKYMGLLANTKTFIQDESSFADFFHEAFVTTYLSDLQNYHAYGVIDENGLVHCYIGFYESIDDSAWYWNQLRSFGDNSLIKKTLDKVIEHNEIRGRLKFYSMFPKQYTKIYRRLAFSKENSERYDSIDEFIVPAKTACTYTLPWQILFNRTLVPVDSIVRLSFLKDKYRNILPIAGRI